MRLIDADALKSHVRSFTGMFTDDGFFVSIDAVLGAIDFATTVDAIPIADMAEMLAESFGDECCCNYNRTDEWLPELCEHSETCPDVIGKNGCWKQFIKHWMKRKMDGGKQDAD